MTLKLKIIFLLLLTPWLIAKGQSIAIKIYNGDSTLTKQYIEAICKAARTKSTIAGTSESDLERLISMASGTMKGDSLQPIKTLKWHKKYGHVLYCQSYKSFEAGDFIRQAIQSDFRGFADLIGPNNRLSLDLYQRDKYDSLHIIDYIDFKRKQFEARNKNERVKFQKDEDWRKIMFYYFLFSEYKINYDPEIDQ